MSIDKLDKKLRCDHCHVAVVDDEPSIRFFLGRLLDTAGIAHRAFNNAESFLEDDEKRWGCLIVDIGLSGMSGLDLLRKLRERHCDAAVVMISGEATVANTIRAFHDQASAFFEKPFKTRDFLNTVQRLVADWEQAEAKRLSVEAKLGQLTAREREVLNLLMTGDTTTQIARDLGISTSTVEKHRLKIYEKTGADSVVRLMRLISA